MFKFLSCSRLNRIYTIILISLFISFNSYANALDEGAIWIGAEHGFIKFDSNTGTVIFDITQPDGSNRKRDIHT